MTTSRSGYILNEFSTDRGNGSTLTLCCTGEDGYFEADIPHSRIVCFLRRSENPELPPGTLRRPVELTDFDGLPLDGLYFPTISAWFNGCRQLKDRGVRLYESDVHPDERFLMEHFLFRGVEVRGSWTQSGGVSRCRAGEVKPADIRPRLSTLSLDIETGRDNTLYCTGLHFLDGNDEKRQVLMLDPQAPEGDEKAGGAEEEFILRKLSSEKRLLEETFRQIAILDPDVIIGWNVIGFDLQFLQKRCRELGVSFRIGRMGGEGRIIRKRSGLYAAEARGRLVIDGPQSLRTGFHSFENFSLDTVANELLGEGKSISADGDRDKIEEIENRFRRDKKALAEYNIRDCLLVSRIFKKTALLEQLITRSCLTGLRMDRVNMSVAAFDFFMLPRVHRHGLAAPDVSDISLTGHAAGGLVFTSAPGLYGNIAVLDYLSLYPSIIRTFSIDPLSRLTAARQPDPSDITTPVGISFSRTRHILPDQIGVLLAQRALAKKEGDSALSQAVKILMNSFYGVMGTPGCRFYHPDLPTAITGTGQWILQNTADFIRSRGFRVIYGDTDSVFVEIPGMDTRQAQKAAEDLVVEANEHFSRLLETEFHTRSQLVLQMEKLYGKFFLPPMRGSAEGSRKRYAGKIAGTEEIEIKGLEYVRSDWTEAAKDFQMELFRRFFLDEEIPRWISGFVEDLRNGRMDSRLVYRRRLTKPAAEYVKNVPPHVKAARILDPAGVKRLRKIEYVMTSRGPVPLAHPHTDLDYDHYIEKQIRPLADSVLVFLGYTFEEIFTGKQHELFS